MWDPFKRFRLPQVRLDGPAFSRWLRSNGPDLRWFLDLPEDMQETLAMLGDDHNAALAVEIGYAVRNPDREAAVNAGERNGGEVHDARALAEQVAAKIMARVGGRQLSEPPPPAPPPAPLTMSGLGDRQKMHAETRQASKGRRFGGRLPDCLEEVVPAVPLEGPDGEEAPG